MQFSVIYSVDCPEDEDIGRFAPPALDLWDETEGDEQYEFGYLEGAWEHGSHRKWCAILDREQFDEFVDHCGLFAETTETMGSLGAPGFGFGWAPAISFTSHDADAIQNAYVTPMPEAKSSGNPAMSVIGNGFVGRCCRFMADRLLVLARPEWTRGEIRHPLVRRDQQHSEESDP